jgi:hypothetical protein
MHLETLMTYLRFYPRLAPKHVHLWWCNPHFRGAVPQRGDLQELDRPIVDD